MEFDQLFQQISQGGKIGIEQNDLKIDFGIQINNNDISKYRGYPIKQLAVKSAYLEVAFLLNDVELPIQLQYDKRCKKIYTHTFVYQDLYGLLSQFIRDALLMRMVISQLSTITTLHPEALPEKNINSIKNLGTIHRMIESITIITSLTYRSKIGGKSNQIHQQLGYFDNATYQ